MRKKIILAVALAAVITMIGVAMKRSFQVSHEPHVLADYAEEAGKMTKGVWLVAFIQRGDGFTTLTLVEKDSHVLKEVTSDRYDPNYKGFVNVDKGDFVQFLFDPAGEKSPRPTYTSYLRPVKIPPQ